MNINTSKMKGFEKLREEIFINNIEQGFFNEWKTRVY